MINVVIPVITYEKVSIHKEKQAESLKGNWIL